MTLRLLIAEDDPSIAQVVAFGAQMTWPRCKVAVVTEGTDALRRFAADRPDLVVLDVEIPPPDGFTVCRRIRETSSVPILMLTVRTSTLDKVRALDLGADDYLTKPFDHLELLARLRALLRRTQREAEAASAPLTVDVTVGDITLDTAMRTACVRGAAVLLTSTECRLLEELMRHAGRTLPRQYLLRQVWGPEYTAEAHYLKVFVGRLRHKLGDDPEHPRYIQTERGSGYRFVSHH
jgi:two-component system, OmpR family, KDP operon response regulator KdpE